MILCEPPQSSSVGAREGCAWGRRALRIPRDLVPDLVPKYMVTVGTRWDLLGLAAAPLCQRVPTSPNSHKHNQDSNSLGGTRLLQARGLSGPISSVKSGHNCLRAGSGCGGKPQLRGHADALLQHVSSPCCSKAAATIAQLGGSPVCGVCAAG